MGTLIWTDTFESYTTGAAISAPWTGDAHSLVLTSQAHAGTKSLGAGTGGVVSSCSRPLGSSPSQWYADFWMWTNSSGSATTLAQFIGFTPTIAGGSACVSVTATGAGTCGLAQSGTSWFTFSVTTNAWHHYVFEVTSAAAGTAKLTVDGTVVGTFSGDTRGGSGSTFVSTVFVVGVNIGPSPPAEFYIDDLSVYSGVNTPVITQDARVMVLA